LQNPQPVQWFFVLPFRHTFSLNIGIIIIYFLAKGMRQHQKVARKWTLSLSWLGVGLLCLGVVAAPLYGGPTLTLSLTISKTEIKNPLFWQVLVTVGAIVPLLWMVIAALTS